jgi:hypothetical protein
MRTATLLAACALVAALAGAAYLLVADTYTSTSCSVGAGLTVDTGERECVTTGETLVEVNGRGVLPLFLVPIGITATLAALIQFRTGKFLQWALAIGLASACFLTALTIGLFFLPAAVLALIAVAVDRPERT